ncbi:SAM-dependent methyltransferase [Streptomyces sp. NBC_01411]|uniref:SAM-dependent methyltransferase n=1 Tax=Streptomyces sp. NBC_01411 TaxID=2903857 RepID=UPI003248A7C2
MTQPAEISRLPEDWHLYPSVARVHEFFLGGFQNQYADRHLAGILYESAPWLPDMIRINERHRPTAVTTLARDLGISQFLDLGCGLPSGWNKRLQCADPPHTYDAAMAIHPDARVVYVDNDPMVCAHARTELDVNANTAVVAADVREIHGLLQNPRIEALSAGPIAVLAHDLLPWMSDESARTVMTVLRDWLPTGSAISVTHACNGMAAAVMKDLADHYASAGIIYRPRTLEEIQTLLGPWTPIPPGIVPTSEWPTTSTSKKSTGRRRCTPNPGGSFAYAAIVTPPAGP